MRPSVPMADVSCQAWRGFSEAMSDEMTFEINCCTSLHIWLSRKVRIRAFRLITATSYTSTGKLSASRLYCRKKSLPWAFGRALHGVFVLVLHG